MTKAWHEVKERNERRCDRILDGARATAPVAVAAAA
jgi:hypothetical protein